MMASQLKVTLQAGLARALLPPLYLQRTIPATTHKGQYSIHITKKISANAMCAQSVIDITVCMTQYVDILWIYNIYKKTDMKL